MEIEFITYQGLQFILGTNEMKEKISLLWWTVLLGIKVGDILASETINLQSLSMILLLFLMGVGCSITFLRALESKPLQ